jgi:hypothetical protein
MEPMDFLLLQMRLEGIRLTRENLLASPSAVSDDHPLALFVKTSDGQVASFFSEILSSELRETLYLNAKRVRFPVIDPVPELFTTAGVAIRIEHFKTYRFPKNGLNMDTPAIRCLPKQDLRILDFGFGGFADDVYAVDEEGVIVSACVSARQNEECAEAWVFTAETHRCRGLAQHVVTAWSRSIQAKKLIPFYSHAFDNVPSAKLAEKLGLFPVFEEVQIQQEAVAGRTTEHR